MINLEQSLLNTSGPPVEDLHSYNMPKSLVLCLTGRARLGQESSVFSLAPKCIPSNYVLFTAKIHLEQTLLNISRPSGEDPPSLISYLSHLYSNSQPRWTLTFSLAPNCVPQHKVLFSVIIQLEQALLNISGSSIGDSLSQSMSYSLILCVTYRPLWAKKEYSFLPCS